MKDIPKRKNKPGFDKKKFYNGALWRNLSKLYREKNPLCAESGDPAECVDHIIAINHGGAPYDYRNLMSMTRETHIVKTIAESSGPIYVATTNADGDLIPFRNRNGDLVRLENHNTVHRTPYTVHRAP